MGPLLLVLTTFIWGTAFLAQKTGADAIGPFGITAYRNVLGGLFLLLCIGVRTVWRRQRGLVVTTEFSTLRSVLAGVACGVPLFVAMLSQQVGIQYTTPGVSAFLTTNYVLFVPVLVALISRRLPARKIWFCAAMAVAGTYFICLGGVGDGSRWFSVGKGEAWTILCAWLFAVQVMAVDRFASRSDLLVMSAAQLFTAAFLSFPFLAFSSEQAYLHGFLPAAEAWGPIVYCGVLSSGVAYTLQNFGQARTPATLAAVLMSLEAVFGALAGFVVRGDVLSTAQFAGCALVFAAVIISQIDFSPLKERRV